MRFAWRIGNLDYLLCQITPEEMDKMRAKHPFTGIPICIAMYDDGWDVYPYPSTGERVVIADGGIPINMGEMYG
jgi:hypothetical protein